MKNRLAFTTLVAVAVFVAACGGGAATPTPTAVLITSPFGGFKITSPVALTETSETVETNIGTLEVTTFQGKSGGLDYSVIYADYPAKYAAVEAATFLAAVRDEQVTTLGGALVSEGDLTSAGIAGREIQISAELEDGTKAIHRSRLYWVPTRLYLVSVLVPAELVDEKAVVDFLDSFQLTDRAY